MIFVDANVPMYLVGAEHRHKHDARRLIEASILNREYLITDTEVFEEILHRYVAIRRRDAIEPAFTALRGIVNQVVAVEFEDVERARTLVLGYPERSARDAIHLAVMERLGVSRIITFDTGFDSAPGITRLH